MGKDGAYLNTSIPGTGLYNRQKIYSPKANKGSNQEAHQDSSNDEERNNSNEFADPLTQTVTFPSDDLKTNTDNTNPQNKGKKNFSIPVG